MAGKAPGRVHRKGITLMELAARFPDEGAARKWFEAQLWPAERCCGHCGSGRTTEASHKTMPYWCSDCRSYFSVKNRAGGLEREAGSGCGRSTWS